MKSVSIITIGLEVGRSLNPARRHGHAALKNKKAAGFSAHGC
jgi:hypothetical protein